MSCTWSFPMCLLRLIKWVSEASGGLDGELSAGRVLGWNLHNKRPFHQSCSWGQARRVRAVRAQVNGPSDSLQHCIIFCTCLDVAYKINMHTLVTQNLILALLPRSNVDDTSLGTLPRRKGIQSTQVTEHLRGLVEDMQVLVIRQT